MRDEVELEIQQDNILPADHPEKVGFKNMTDWLYEGGSRFPWVKMTYYSKNFRGTTATRDYKCGDEVVFIPKSHLIIHETCFDTPIGKKMYDNGLLRRT